MFNIGATESLLPFSVLLVVFALVMPITGFYIDRVGSQVANSTSLSCRATPGGRVVKSYRLGTQLSTRIKGINTFRTDNVSWQIIRGGDDENAKRVLRLDPTLEKSKELEAIDNPHLYDKFVKIAEDYLSNSKATVGMGLKVTPKEAIKKFIENNPIALPVGVNRVTG